MPNVLFGAQKDPEDSRDYLASNLLKNTITPAVSQTGVDWELDMTPVKNQGKLGSCVAFAVVAVKEWQEKTQFKQTFDQSKLYDLSEQWLYYKCKDIDVWPGVEGTSFRFAMKVLTDSGVPVEQGWSYDAVHKGEPEKWAANVAQWYKCGSYWRIASLEEFKLLLTRGPLAIGVICFDGIFRPNDQSVVPMPKRGEKRRGGHAICAVGFDDSAELIKFKNSWGTEWGAHGYGYISYDYFKMYCLDAWYFADTEVIQNTFALQRPVDVPKKAPKEIKSMKKKLVNKLPQLQEVHIVRNGKDTTIPILAGQMVAVASEEMSEDIRARIAKGFLEIR